MVQEGMDFSTGWSKRAICSGTKVHREVRVRSGSTTWAYAEVEIVDARDKKPWAVRQQTPFCIGSSKLFQEEHRLE